MSRFWSPGPAADPPTSPPAPRLMLLAYTWGIGHLVREIGGYLWEKGYRRGLEDGRRRAQPAPTLAGDVMCPNHPDVTLANCPWGCGNSADSGAREPAGGSGE